MIEQNQLVGCPITVDDANRALKIYGSDVPTLRGKTVRKTPEHIPSNQERTELPKLLEEHGRVTICFDIFFVDGHAFFSTVSRNIHFITVEHIASRHIQKQVLPCLKKVNNVYTLRGFKIVMAHADEEFGSAKDGLLELDNIGLNIAATNEHVPEIERAIRTIKERNRCMTSSLPDKKYPKLLKIELVKNAVTWLNMFPHPDGISDTLSPRAIMTGLHPKFNTHCRVPIGAYCEVHNENDPSNTESPRTTPAIALNPTGNLQGSYHFMSLTTGARLSRRRWTELPTTDAVITRVHELALLESTYDADAPDFQYTWDMSGTEIVDTDMDAPPYDSTNEDEEAAGAREEEMQDEVIEEGQIPFAEPTATAATTQPELGDQPTDPGSEGDPPLEEDAVATETMEEERPDLLLRETEETLAAFQEGDGAGPETESVRYNLRGNRMNFSHKYVFLQHPEVTPKGPQSDTATDLRNHVMATGFLFNQMGIKPGVKAYGERAVEAVIAECTQLDDKGAFKPRSRESLTKLDLQRALRAITLVKEKRSGKIKGRTVADGRGQRDFINREDATSPTVAIESLMISIAIDANEGRDVATADIEGAYLYAGMDKEDTVIMVYEGSMVEYMVSANPRRYAPYVHTTASGKKLLYVELLKALYGCIKSALLWYNLFVSTLKDMGFTINPYDPCVANKMIDDKQCTICWYVDDLKISHIDAAVVTGVVKEIEEKYGKMVVTRGSDHVYVGMNISFPGNGEAKIFMKEYIEECISRDFPEDCFG
jgi:Reverse transcriptase (RNA-dependent DNA polymerase)